MLITTAMIFLVGALSEVVNSGLITIFGQYAAYLAYPVSALLIAPLSFFLKRRYVFK
jgi:hypothetical protein